MVAKLKPIPHYPIFRDIRLYDKSLIDTYSSNYPELSELTFSSLYSWRMGGLMTKIARLDDDLIIKTCDVAREKYSTWVLSKDFSKINTKLSKIFQKTPDVTVTIPGIWDKDIKTDYKSNLDDINHEYIYNTFDLRNVVGNKYAVVRANINKFKRNYPDYKVKYISKLSTASKSRALIVKLFTDWNRYKNGIKQGTSYFEFDALERYLLHSKLFNVVVIGIYYEKDLIAFGTIEIDTNIPKSNVVAKVLFAKSNHAFKGASEFLMNNLAKYLDENGIKFLNFEQDLGIDSLKQFKQKLRPQKILEIYRIKNEIATT